MRCVSSNLQRPDFGRRAHKVSRKIRILKFCQKMPAKEPKVRSHHCKHWVKGPCGGTVTQTSRFGSVERQKQVRDAYNFKENAVGGFPPPPAPATDDFRRGGSGGSGVADSVSRAIKTGTIFGSCVKQLHSWPGCTLRARSQNRCSNFLSVS